MFSPCDSCIRLLLWYFITFVYHVRQKALCYMGNYFNTCWVDSVKSCPFYIQCASCP